MWFPTGELYFDNRFSFHLPISLSGANGFVLMRRICGSGGLPAQLAPT